MGRTWSLESWTWRPSAESDASSAQRTLSPSRAWSASGARLAGRPTQRNLYASTAERLDWHPIVRTVPRAATALPERRQTRRGASVWIARLECTARTVGRVRRAPRAMSLTADRRPRPASCAMRLSRLTLGRNGAAFMAADSARMDESVSPAPTAVVRSKTKQTANNALRGAQELAGSVRDAGRANSPRRTTAPAFSATIPAAHGTVLSATTLTARMAPCATRALQAGNRTKLGPRAKPAHPPMSHLPGAQPPSPPPPTR